MNEPEDQKVEEDLEPDDIDYETKEYLLQLQAKRSRRFKPRKSFSPQKTLSKVNAQKTTV
jgi:hypothetical protein